MPKPLAALSHAQANEIQWLLTDVDDTLTWEGKLPPETLQALNKLELAGIKVVAVTGACAGWCDQIAKLWPVHGVIGENGAFWMRKSESGFVTHSLKPLYEMRAQQQALISLLQELLSEYPGIELANDQAFRFCDVAINIGQDRIPVSNDVTTSLLNAIQQLELNGEEVKATQSSIHINVWVGEHSKCFSSEKYLENNANGHSLSSLNIAYIGDSLNDESMFAWLPTTFGVNNIQPHLESLNAKPKFITSSKGGYGFAELTDHLLTLRS
ncbi:HAD-IIB family hydrolase [Vibrio maerlii]|uniref:HAD-IIB family hydrolase n=1 Tax=Vibrio maerlii TaxID=2231648 RepID=UPI000E3BC332|nr:HAD-IIB family hydrolase [Vibrio maerlii]